MTMLALAATVTTVAVPAAAYYLTKPGDDPLGDTLRQYGFVPINPPPNLMNVGSLYCVDGNVKDGSRPALTSPSDGCSTTTPTGTMSSRCTRRCPALSWRKFRSARTGRF